MAFPSASDPKPKHGPGPGLLRALSLSQLVRPTPAARLRGMYRRYRPAEVYVVDLLVDHRSDAELLQLVGQLVEKWGPEPPPEYAATIPLLGANGTPLALGRQPSPVPFGGPYTYLAEEQRLPELHAKRRRSSGAILLGFEREDLLAAERSERLRIEGDARTVFFRLGLRMQDTSSDLRQWEHEQQLTQAVELERITEHQRLEAANRRRQSKERSNLRAAERLALEAEETEHRTALWQQYSGPDGVQRLRRKAQKSLKAAQSRLSERVRKERQRRHAQIDGALPVEAEAESPSEGERNDGPPEEAKLRQLSQLTMRQRKIIAARMATRKAELEAERRAAAEASTTIRNTLKAIAERNSAPRGML